MPQPYDWYVKSWVAVHVPLARTFPWLSVWVNAPEALTDLGCTENGPSPVTAIWSPLDARETLGCSMCRTKVSVVLAADAPAAPNIEKMRIRVTISELRRSFRCMVCLL